MLGENVHTTFELRIRISMNTNNLIGGRGQLIRDKKMNR